MNTNPENKPTVYVETSIFSYLAARPAGDAVGLARQNITKLWWTQRRPAYQLYLSRTVFDEAELGDPVAAQRRLALMQKIHILEEIAQADIWARALMAEGMLPPKARVDALHLSLATAYQIDFLLTWNCRHLANAHLMRQLHRWFEEHAGRMPLICTPDQLLERFPHG